MNCDYFYVGIPPPSDHIVASADLYIRRMCGADLDKSDTFCGAKIPRRADLAFESGSENGLYLRPINGAEIAPPDSAKMDCSDAKYQKEPVRIDGFGPGHDMCLHTDQGHVSHLFFTDQVNVNDTSLHLWIVTR